MITPRLSRVLQLGLVLTILALPATAAEFFVQALPNNTFSPANITIQTGDTVTWTNGGGFHNVRAQDGSFRCANGCDGEGGDGDPANNAWSFSRTFNTPGTIDYDCELHVGLGMVGSVTVQAGGGSPGQLRFAAASTSVNENVGNAVISVNRVGGDDGAVSVNFATSNGSATAGADYTAQNGTLNWADEDDDPKTFMVPITNDTLDEPNETVNLTLSNPTGGATLGSPTSATLTILDDDAPPVVNAGTLAFQQTDLQIDEDGGSATVSVTRSGGDDGAVSVSYDTSDGSATAGDDYTASSGTLDWADGDSAAKTFDVPVLDDATPEANETVNLALSNPTGGADLGADSTATLTIADNDQTFGPCVEDEQTLCLNENGRFQVQVDWRSPNAEGAGQAVTIGREDSGLFFFFNDDNIEMLVKVLDACALPAFESYWVFFAATTNVEFTLTVTDTEAGVQKQYSNALGNPAAPVQDTRAFETCP